MSRAGTNSGKRILAAWWFLGVGAFVAMAQRAGSPVAILTQILTEAGVDITQQDIQISRKAAVGELLFPGDQARGRGVVVECRGKGSVQWFPSQSAPYVAGKGVDGRPETAPVADCQMPEAAPPA